MSHSQMGSVTRQLLAHASHINAWASFVLCCLNTTSFAATSDGLPTAPEQVVLVRGQDSIVQELNMGPDATALWRKIQAFVAGGAEIADFSQLVDRFELGAQNPINETNPSETQAYFRRDFRGKNGMACRGAPALECRSEKKEPGAREI